MVQIYLGKIFYFIKLPIPQNGDATPLWIWKITMLTWNSPRKDLAFWVLLEVGTLEFLFYSLFSSLLYVYLHVYPVIIHLHVLNLFM